MEALRDAVHDDHATRVRAIDAVAHRLVEEVTLDERRPAQLYGQRQDRRIPVRYFATAMAALALALISGYVSFFDAGYMSSNQGTSVLSANNSPIGPMTLDENGATYVFFEATERGHGTRHQPYQTLEQAIDSAEAGSVIKINSGSSSELLRIAQPVRLVAVDGTVRIGRS